MRSIWTNALILSAVWMAAGGVPAPAAFVVYDNGPRNPANGNEMTQWIQAENFTLAAAETLVGVRFTSGEFSPGYTGSITWQIYADAAGTPGSLLTSGTTAAVTRTAVAPVGVFTSAFENEFSIGSVPLAAGNYWLGLHNGPLTTTSRLEMYWMTSTTGFGPNGQEDVTPFGTGGFFSNGQEHTFQLLAADAAAVPAPAGLLLGLIGAGPAVALIRRRRAAVA